MAALSLGRGDLTEGTQTALQKLQSALDARDPSKLPYDPVMLAMAQGFLSPSKTGSFGESLGQAAGSVLPVVQQQQKDELETSKFRLELAKAEQEQGKTQQAFSMLANALNMPPEQVAAAIQNGTLPRGAVSKIDSSLMIAVGRLDPKLGQVLKDAYGMDIENAKLALELYKGGVQRAELEAKFGKGILDILPKAPFSAAPSAPTPPAPPAPKPKVEVNENIRPEQNQRLAILNQELRNAETALAQTTDSSQKERLQGDIAGLKREMGLINKTPETKVAPAAADKKGDVIQDDLAWLPLETQNKIRAERQKEIDAPFSEKRKAITAFDPQYVSTSNSRLRELYQLAEQHPQIFGLMQEKGFFNALGSAAQQGSQTPWGTWSLPVTTFVQKMKLTPEQQTIATRASQLLAEQFFENAKTNKSVLGPSISNADVMLLKAPIATAEDSAEAIKYWVKQSRLGNAQKLDLYNAMSEWDARNGAKGSPSAFFSSKNPNYGGITQKYETLTDQLVRQHSPSWVPKPKDKQ
jgi:hypothetical protein